MRKPIFHGNLSDQPIMNNADIKNLINKATESLDLEQAILFGSRARGDFSRTSDDDILLVVKNDLAMQDKIKWSTFLRRLFAKKGMDVEILIRSSAEIAYSKDKVGNVVKYALSEGVPLC